MIFVLPAVLPLATSPASCKMSSTMPAAARCLPVSAFPCRPICSRSSTAWSRAESSPIAPTASPRWPRAAPGAREGTRRPEHGGTVSLVYDYRKRNLQRKLADIQHRNYLMIVTSTRCIWSTTITSKCCWSRDRPRTPPPRGHARGLQGRQARQAQPHRHRHPAAALSGQARNIIGCRPARSCLVLTSYENTKS